MNKSKILIIAMVITFILTMPFYEWIFNQVNNNPESVLLITGGIAGVGMFVYFYYFLNK